MGGGGGLYGVVGVGGGGAVRCEWGDIWGFWRKQWD